MRNKILLTLFAAAMLFAGCCKDKDIAATGFAKVKVTVSDFAVSQEDFSKAQSVGTYSGVKFLTLAFYTGDGTEVYKVTQQKENMGEGETFGEFSTALAMGSYTMVVLGCGGNNMPTLTSATSATFGENVVGETFVATRSVTVNSNADVNLDATLDRIVSGIAIVSTDGRADEAKKLRITTSTGSRSFNPTTGLATENSGIIATITHPEAVGTVTRSATLFFLAADEQEANVTIETLDENDQVLFSKTVENVPLKRNRLTILTGALYSATATAGSFQVNTDWLGNYNMNF